MTRHDASSHKSGGRLAALVLRHAALEAAVGSEQSRPVPDMAALQALKRKRLAVKEQIHRLGAAHVPQDRTD
ncbi:MAG: DUF465 domain-containing protein [Pseudomonadota bacterium]